MKKSVEGGNGSVRKIFPIFCGVFILLVVSSLIGFCQWRVRNIAFDQVDVLKSADVNFQDRVKKTGMNINWPFSGEPIIE